MLKLSLILALALTLAGHAMAGEPTKTDGSDVGITIMGAIVERNSDDNVALVKDQTGSVKAVKKDFIILDKYKVVAVHAEYIEVVTREAKVYQIYQDKFAGSIPTKKSDLAAAGISGAAEQYKEEGFERVKGKITMTGIYRDKLVKEDLARVLMQATAEPFMENGAIVGFKIFQIDDGSIYAKSGVQNNDVITAINGSELNSVAGSIALLRTLKGADHLDVEIRRDGLPQKISIDVN